MKNYHSDRTFDHRVLPDVVTPDGLARFLGVGTDTVRRWLREGIVPGRKLGRSWFVPRLPFILSLAEPGERMTGALTDPSVPELGTSGGAQ